MSDMRPHEAAADWTGMNMEQKALACAAMLNIHGFTTDAENARIKQRIHKWRTQFQVKGETK